MRVFKLMAIVAALALALAGCELDEEGADGGGTGGGDTIAGADGGGGNGGASCQGIGNEVTAADWEAAGDDSCDTNSFFDPDCQGEPNDSFTFRCGKNSCDFNENICEAMQPCGAVQCLIVDDIAIPVARPCPNDPDCFGTADEPAIACEADGHCDTWCPVLNGVSIDTDCGAGGGDYCPGGANVDQC